jgi:FMN phosphatase YigB (HAD superfamily)/DNA-binding XRE family transcriptional regulator
MLGKKIQNARKNKDITQEELADKANLAYSTIAKIERGAIADPSFSTIVSITKALDLPISDLATVKTPTHSPTAIKPKEKIKFVYCDVNGVLVRFFQKAFVSMAEKCELNPEVVESAFWHYNAAANVGEMTTAQFNKAMAKHLNVPKIDWEAEYMAAVEPVLAMHECLKEVAKTTKVGLLTNIFPKFVPSMINTGLIPDLDYSVIIDSSQVGHVKPEPEIYAVAQEKAGVSGSQILFIDDSRTNLMAAELLGWHVLWFDDYRPTESVKRVRSAIKI